MSTPTLHRIERRTEFPPEQYVSAKMLETFFRDFHPFKNPAEHAVELFQDWLSVACHDSNITLVVWCTKCYHHHEHCNCTTEEINLDQWRIPQQDLSAMRGQIEQGKVVFGGHRSTYALEFSEYIRTHSSL